MFDTGYQRVLLLDSMIRFEQNFPKDLDVIKETKLLNSSKVFVTKVVDFPDLNIAGQQAFNISAQIINTANPSGIKTHILGNELMKSFNAIFDFKNGFIYLERNSLYNEAYVDAK